MLDSEITEFLIYVIPGFIAIEIYRAHYPAKKTNTFSQVAWSVVYGIGISVLVRFMDQYFLNSWLRSGTEGFPSKKFIASLLAMGVLAGYDRILIREIKTRLSVRFVRLKFLKPDPQSIWAEVNKPQNTDWAVVFLNDGSIYLGWIDKYSFDPNEKDQDFLLSKAEKVDERLNTLYRIDGDGVYFSTKNVSRIEFIRHPGEG